jgi:CheY-like chemotaxis protein
MNKKKGKILVVDDNKSIYRLICHILSKKGFRIDYAKDGYDALKLLRWENFDIIFLDIIMPRMSGLEFMPKLKRIKNKIPTVIAITGFKTLECEKEVVKLGAVVCLHKPLVVTEITNLVDKYLPQTKSKVG